VHIQMLRGVTGGLKKSQMGAKSGRKAKVSEGRKIRKKFLVTEIENSEGGKERRETPMKNKGRRGRLIRKEGAKEVVTNEYSTQHGFHKPRGNESTTSYRGGN